MSEWRAAVVDDRAGDHADPLSAFARLVIYSRYDQFSSKGQSVVTGGTADGHLILSTYEEGAVMPVGLLVPREMLEPIREAIERMNGRPETNYQTEVKVLREMLKIEQDRVDWQMGRNR